MRRVPLPARKTRESLPRGTITDRPSAKYLTKGDNNAADDTSLYAAGQDHIGRGDILGCVVGYVPFVGYVTIMLSEHPWLKTVMLGLMGLTVVLQRE
jgi:signal peptidase